MTDSKLIILKSLANEIDDALKTHNKWVSVIDVEGNAEVFFKYQGTSVFSILEKEVAPENLCRSILTMVKYPRTLTINYLDLPYNNIFDEKLFPEEVLDVAWVNKFENIEKLRQNFLQEFPEEIFPSPDFKMCFLFRKDNVPELLHKKTKVLEICAPSEIEELREQREEARKAREEAAAKLEEEKKVEEPKVEAKKPVVGNKSASSAKTAGATVKTTAKVNVSTAPKTGVTSKTTSTPVKTTATVTKTSTSGTKTTVTASTTAKASSTTKITTKK